MPPTVEFCSYRPSGWERMSGNRDIDPEFSEKSVDVSKHLAKVYRQIAEKENIPFLNAAAYAKPSAADQEHMDPENHRLLAEAIYQKVIEIEGILG